MNDGPGGILVVRGGAIGDFILTLPVLTALRRQFPQARLEVLGYPHIVELAVAGGLADDVRSIEARALAGFFARGGQLDPGLGSYFAKFSVLLSYLYDPDRIFQENVGRVSNAQFIAGPHRPFDDVDQHATEVFLQPLEQLAIFGGDPVPRLEVAPSPDPALPPGSWLALHPGSGSELKNWPEENWRTFIDRLVAGTGMNLLLVGGEAEGSRLHPLADAVPPARLKLAKGLPLSTLARFLKRCVGFVGHDSGITHLAAAVGLPCVVLWGPTAASVWRPLGDNVQILRSDGGLAGIGIGEVLGRTTRLCRSA